MSHHDPWNPSNVKEINATLRRLTVAYPDFTFGHEIVSPWKGPRWVAERKDRNAPGLRVAITDDLMELYRELAKDKEQGLRDAQAAVRADSGG